VTAHGGAYPATGPLFVLPTCYFDVVFQTMDILKRENDE
jgi:hypothetical protein